MYLDYFGLNDYPFRITPDADYLYMSSAHSRAIKYMEYAILNKEGFVLITGEIGCGKTTIIKKIIDNLDDNVIIAKLFQTQLDEVELLQSILTEFGVNKFSNNKVELLSEINQFLVDSYVDGKQVILIVDDAQNLSKRALEEIKMLSCVETNKDKLIQIILVGQPELNDKIDAQDMEQLLQRISLRYHVKRLTRDETKEYIGHRLTIAGVEKELLFDDDVYDEIFDYTNGTPRLINTLCDTSLTCAYAESRDRVTLQDVQDAAAELQWNKDKNNSKSLADSPVPDEYQNDSLYHEPMLSTMSNVTDLGLNRTMADISWQLTRIADSLESFNTDSDSTSKPLALKGSGS